ncbi:preprotein translocase subunit SecE [Enterococcus sp. CSURQ0835]|uniref:preprotein translocase subunit SecE n=1 Tax=Enterococcus sp. CSURQ0835 TaxID=2681394 RepID=UPI00135B8259|nr:preprotein translocase subunit SecE [Enterococcus sp. CSURQ0835]
MKFLRSVREEMKLVTWPSKKKLAHDSLVVIETSIIFAAMFFVMDTAIQALFKLVVR